MAVLFLVVALLAPFRLDAGPYSGAYRVTPDGAVNWYFATTALLRLRKLPLPATRAYLDAYLAHLDPYEGIADALPMPSGIYAPIAPDSEDAYAATILSLASRYRRESHDDAWWKRTAATWSDIAYAKLLTQFKPDGLIRASRTDATGYLMDNVEDYAGLRDFEQILTQTHASNAAYVGAFIAPLGSAIAGLYDDSAHAFRWSDSDPLGPLVPYPACTAQLFPQLYDVRGSSHKADVRHFTGARETAAKCHLSLGADPHEALLYAIYISKMRVESRSERAFVERVREHAPASGDIITMTLLDALGVSQK
jgi:hypothetical protein